MGLFESLIANDAGITGTRRCYQVAPFRYAGSKFAALDFVLPLFKPSKFSRYVEGCGGGGSVLLNKPRHKFEVFNDKCEMLSNFFTVLFDRPDALADALKMLPTSRVIWKDFHDRVCESKLDNRMRYAIMWYYMQCNSFGGCGEAFGRALKALNQGHLAHLGQFRMYAQRLKGVLIECKDIMTILGEFDGNDTEIYLDPPYLKEACQSNDKYTCKMSKDNHIDMIEKVLSMEARVVISSYDNALYNSYDWDEVVKYTMNVNNVGNGYNTSRTKQIEKAYIKYERFA
jgi:DNA adenine methylase